MICATVPAPTWTCLSLSSEARTAAASAHRTESDGEAAGEAVVDDEAAPEGVLPDEAVPDPHPAISSARPHAIMTSRHRAAAVAPVRCFMSLTGSQRRDIFASSAAGYFPRPFG